MDYVGVQFRGDRAYGDRVAVVGSADEAYAKLIGQSLDAGLAADVQAGADRDSWTGDLQGWCNRLSARHRAQEGE